MYVVKFTDDLITFQMKFSFLQCWNSLRLSAKSVKVEYSKIVKKTGGNSKKPKPPTTYQEEINGLFGNFGIFDVFGHDIGFKKGNLKQSLLKCVIKLIGSR